MQNQGEENWKLKGFKEDKNVKEIAFYHNLRLGFLFLQFSGVQVSDKKQKNEKLNKK